MNSRRRFNVAKSILLLRLEGPIQSWGTRARWDVRDSGHEPTKSGVIGLIGCAMGLSRGDQTLERLDRDLIFGVRTDRPGVVSADFHTVTGYHRTAAGEFKHKSGTAKSLEKARDHKENTIVSPRDYLHDAAFLVALASDDQVLLRQLAGETEHPHGTGDLKRPTWPLYLGRKACVPSRPIFDRLAEEYRDIEDALRGEPWAGPRKETDRILELEAWIECSNGDYERQDAVRLNQFRFYEFRRCRRIEIDASSLRRIP